VQTKIGGGHRRSPLPQIVGARDKNPPDGPDPFANQIGIRQRTDANREIDPLFHEIGDAIKQEHRHGDAWMLVKKRAHHRHERRPTKCH
jgi:hypothetical protein